MNEVNRGGGALRCEEARVLLMGFLDGELSADEVARLEDHLAVCPACRADHVAYRQLGAATDQLATREWPVDSATAWERIYDRVTRSVGWLLLWVGLVLMAGYGLWMLGSEFMLDSEVPLVLRAGIGAFTLGALLLLVNILRERFHRERTERYSEVQR